MKHRQNGDYPVQVWREERQVPLETAKFYQGIFDVNIEYLANIMFVPSFRNKHDWSPTFPGNVHTVHSEEEARLYTAALADYTVTPDVSLAGQEESVRLPLIRGREPEMGVVFYVTPDEFAAFSQELRNIEKQTFWANEYVPLSKVKDLESMKFILSKVVPLEERRDEARKMHDPSVNHVRNQ